MPKLAIGTKVKLISKVHPESTGNPVVGSRFECDGQITDYYSKDSGHNPFTYIVRWSNGSSGMLYREGELTSVGSKLPVKDDELQNKFNAAMHLGIDKPSPPVEIYRKDDQTEYYHKFIDHLCKEQKPEKKSSIQEAFDKAVQKPTRPTSRTRDGKEELTQCSKLLWK